MSFNDGFTKNSIAAPTTPAVSGNVLVYNGTQWVGGTVSGGGTGDITSVTAGTNLTGGGSSGDVTVSLDTNVTGLTNLQATSITGSFNGNLNGTASFATSASYAGNSLSSSFASNSTSASFANTSTSASFATTSSFATAALTSSYMATSSGIATFTADVRAQFSAGTNITINDGVISASAAVTASSTVYNREWHVSNGSGNDTTGNGTLLSPYKTVAKAASVLSAGGGEQLVIHAGTYPENVTITVPNTTVVAAQGSNGGEVYISGTLTISQSISPASSIRLFGIATYDVIHRGTGSLFMEDCKVNNSFTKATTAYFQATNTDFNKDILILSGGFAAFQGGNQSTSGSNFTINNPSAFVTIRDSITTYSPVVISGTLGFNDCAIVATSSGGPAVTSLSPSSVVVMVDSTTLDTNQLPTKVTIGGLFSYSNSVFNKTASTLGTNLSSIADFDIIRANTGSLTTLTYTPATPGNWAGAAPTTVKSAIDRLAAAVFTLRGNSPIP